jgi:gliding motility-associated-like protein
MAYGQSVVVSSYMNSGDPRDEWTELLVIQDNIDISNYTVRDNNSSQTNWQTAVTFLNVPLWNHLRAGTIIVLWHRQFASSGALHPLDVSGNDGYIEVHANDPAYFTGGDFGTPPFFSGNSMNVAGNGDIIQVRNNSGTHIHALGHISTPGTSWTALPAPKLNHAQSLSSGEAVFVCPGANLADYGTPPQNGTTYTSKSNTLFTLGLPNQCAASSTANSDFWRSQRQPAWTAPTMTATYTLPSTINLAWNNATDPYPADNTQGYLILRNTADVFTAPTDGHTCTVGEVIGGATVIAVIPSSQTLTYTDNYAIPCGTSVYYRVYAHRYGTDPAGNDFNVARGRAYNETNFAAASINIAAAPAITAVDAVDATCGLNNGSITITATGGTPPLQYSIDNGTTWQASNTFINLPPGSYLVIIKDINECQTVFSGNPVVISNIAGPVIDQVSHTDATCGIDNGTITINANGGTPPLEYSIDNGVTWQTSNVFSDLPPGSYIVVINDLNGCQLSYSGNPVIILDFPAPTITQVDFTDASCGNNNGSITITAAGGTPPLQYSIDNGITWQASAVFSNLAPGNYLVMIQDNNNCQVPYASNPVVISMIPAPVAPASASSDRDNFCADDPGNIVLTATGGSGLALEWFTGSCGGTFIGTGNNLSIPSPVVTTIYYVYWTSTACGNSSCASVTVTVVEAPTLSDAGPDQSLCGVLTATLTGNQPLVGTGLWTQFAGPGSSVFTDPTLYNSQVTVSQNGAYTFRWTISNGTACTPSTDDVVVTFSDAVTVTAGSNSPVCVGNTIYLTSSITGATYAWTGPDGFTSDQQNPEIPNATMANEGTYNVTVSNIPGGCPPTSGSTLVDILDLPLAPSSASANPDEICAGYAGLIQLTATGGSGTQLVWSSETCNGTVIGTGTVIDIPAPAVTTTYYASWTSDQCGSSSCASVTVTVFDPPSTADAGADQSLCGVLTTLLEANDPAVGTGEWTVVSGPGTVTFADPALYNTQVNVSLEGIYVLQWIITNGAVCAPSADEVSLNFGDAIQVVAGSNSPVCTGTDINLTSSISGATYSWTGPNGFTSNLQNPVIPNAVMGAAGTYTVQVTDIPGGCPPTSNSTDVVMNQSPAEPSSVASDITSLCAGSAGNITLTATGGSGDALEWLTGGCSGTVIGTGVTLVVPAPAVTTTYDARWTSASCGNSTCKSVTVFVEDPPTTANAGPDQSICNDFYATMAANTPITGSGQWTTISGPGTITFTDPASPNTLVNASILGTYVLQWTITNGGICPASSDDLTVEFGNQIIVTASSNSPVCEGEDITLFSSIAGATYNWTGPGGFTSTLQNPIITNASVAGSGDYTITVSDIPGGCPATSATITVVVSSIPSAPMVNSQNINGTAQDVCEGSIVSYSIALPVAGSDYTWVVSGGGTISPAGPAEMIEIEWFATNGTYDLAVTETNAAGCESAPFALTITINPMTYPAITIQADKNPTCEGTAVQFTAAVTDGGTAPVYKWTRNGIQVGGNNSVYVLDTPADDDLITCEVTPGSLCADPAIAVSNAIEMTVYDSLKISCTDQEPVCSGTPTLLTPGSSFVSYLWSDGSTGSSITVIDPGVYWVMVTDTAGCTATDTIVVEPCSTMLISIPNAFTPNADGNNDRFNIVCSNPAILTAYEINIYNRWGQLIYTGRDIGDGWDGTLDGNPFPMDVYMYFITYTVTEPRIESKQIAGKVTLVR